MRVLFAAGGTGGHLIPAIRIAEAVLRFRSETEMLFVGSDKGFEERVVTRRGFRYVGLPARGLSRRQLYRNIPAIFGNLRAMRQSRALIRSFAPTVAVGCGGYASYFPLRECRRRGIPYVVQEQNSYPGLVTRWLAPDAAGLFLAFADARKHVPASTQAEIIGNPVDPALGTMNRDEARASWALRSEETVILVTGGSGGARSINANIAEGLKTAPERPLTVLWQTGRQGAPSVEPASGWTVKRFEFTDQMTAAMTGADIIIARAGALSISEITAAGRPALLVPFPYAAADHQTHNARSLADAGAAVIVEDGRLGGVSLLHEAASLLAAPGRLDGMARASRGLGQPNAADTIARKVIAVGEKAQG